MTTSKQNAFTLIELLVVISIIAILAGIALPVFGEVQIRGAQTKALSNAKQVGLACKLFAQDYDGNFPLWTTPATKTGTPTDANAALQVLIPDYIPDKGVFSIPKSAYCKKTGSGNSSSASASILNAGENEWAYVIGLSDTSNSRFPLLLISPAKCASLKLPSPHSLPRPTTQSRKPRVSPTTASKGKNNSSRSSKNPLRSPTRTPRCNWKLKNFVKPPPLQLPPSIRICASKSPPWKSKFPL